MSAFDCFDRVYCIHLPDPGRRKAIDAQFAKVGIVDPQYVYAERPKGPFTMSNMRRAPKYEFGVNLSHIKAVAHAITDGAKRPLFLEDDIVFANNADEVLGAAITELDKYMWDVLYLGGHPCEPVSTISDNLVKVGRFSFAEAYSVNGSALRRLQDFWYNSIGQDSAMYDFILSRFAGDYGYCTFPVITNQPPGYSHIAGRKDNKTGLVSKGWMTNT